MRNNGDWLGGRRAKKSSVYLISPSECGDSAPVAVSGAVLFTVGEHGPGRDFRSDLQKHGIFVQLCIFVELRAIFA